MRIDPAPGSGAVPSQDALQAGADKLLDAARSVASGFGRGSTARTVHEPPRSRCSTPQQMLLEADVRSPPRQLSRCHLLEACPPHPERLYSQHWVNAEQVLWQLTLDTHR